MAQHLRVDLGSLPAMRYTVASLRCVPQSMQGVHGVVVELVPLRCCLRFCEPVFIIPPVSLGGPV